MIHLLYSDVHLRPERLDDQMRCLRFIGELAKKFVVPSGGFVINGGDLFHERGVIKTACFDRLREVRVQWMVDEIVHIDNVGNHDQEDFQGTVHPLRIFDHFDGCHVADGVTFVDPWWVVPYTRDLPAALKDIPDDALVVIHAGVRGAKMSAGIEDSDSILPDVFDRFRRVFAGHYHRHQTIGKVTFIGSPLQQDFGEAGEKKGVLLYDDKKDKVRMIEVPGMPKFHKVVMGESVEDEIDKNDFVAITVRGDHKVVLTSKEDLQKSVAGRLVKVERELTERRGSRMIVDDAANLAELMVKYAAHKSPDLDMKRLMKVGKELVDG